MAEIAGAQTVDTTLWCLSPSGIVNSTTRVGNTIYIGGVFYSVGPASGGGVPVETDHAAPAAGYPKVVGQVTATVSDGRGGWFIGGQFVAVGGRPKANLAHIQAGGIVAPWAPNPNGPVWALSLSGQTLYIGGAFDSVGGQPRRNVAAVSTTDDAPMDWDPDANGGVESMLVTDSAVFLGGWFTIVGGQARPYVAAVDRLTGRPSPWTVNADGKVMTFALRDTTLVIGGFFRTLNGAPHRYLAAVGSTSGIVLSWDAAVSRYPAFTYDGGPRVNAVLFSGDSLFVAGAFTSIGGQDRQGLAQLDWKTAQATSWDPLAIRHIPTKATFRAMVRSGDTLFVAGEFDSLGGRAGRHVSALSVSTAVRLDWDPNPNGFLWALALGERQVYLGGAFTSVGAWASRRSLAAIDATTGRVTDWDPQPDGSIRRLLAYGGKIFVGGAFSSVGGQSRVCIAALDPVTGEATAWNPRADGDVWAIEPMGGTLIAGGFFTRIGGQPRGGIAAIDTATGLATSWNPSGGEVYGIAVSDSAIYVGGDFLSIGGQSRSSLAALDPVTGLATLWNPGVSGIVNAIALLNGTIYVGGWFTTAGGLPRANLAAIDHAGVPTAWIANTDERIRALIAVDGTIYAGGFFSTVGGRSCPYFAEIDAQTGECRDRYPIPNGYVWSITDDGNDMYLGGRFEGVGTSPQAGFARITTPRRVVPPPPSFVLSQNAPNPVRQSAVIRYTLPRTATVSLAVYDLQGRRVHTLMGGEHQTPGPHEFTLSTDGWPPGCYLYRLEAGFASATRKMVVLK